MCCLSQIYLKIYRACLSAGQEAEENAAPSIQTLQRKVQGSKLLKEEFTIP